MVAVLFDCFVMGFWFVSFFSLLSLEVTEGPTWKYTKHWKDATLHTYLCIDVIWNSALFET